MKIVFLNEYESEFLSLCKYFFKNNDRNKDWFNPDLPWSVVNRYNLYPHWTFLLDDVDKFMAMSCIQTHFYPSNCARVLTRTFYNPEVRRLNLAYEKNKKTPAMYMFENHVEWAKSNNISNLFLSVEYIRRKSSIIKFIEKINDTYNYNWKVLDNLYQTYPEDNDPASWQVVASNETTLPLKNMPIDEWKKKYGR